MGSDFYDRQGNPIDDVLEWARLYESTDRVVGLDVIGDARVSTVWMGLRLGLSLGGPPLIFETMIFGGDHDGDQWRYATEEAALAGHDQAVALVQGRGKP